MAETKPVVFKNKQIRRHWDEAQEKWYFSVTDVIEVLTGSGRSRKYWNDLKAKLKDEGSQVSEKIGQLKMMADDGKYYLTDAADTETIFRIIQTIPSPNAEPFKLWLAKVGYERVEEVADPELAINRAIRFYQRQGRTREWIDLRLKSIEIRKGLTNEWEDRGVIEGKQFAILTDDITFAWSGLKTKDYKKFKDLKKESLRDNMTNLELVLNMLAEASTTEISKKEIPETFPQNRQVARAGGRIAGGARKNLEKRLGHPVISSGNFLNQPESAKRLKGS